MTQIVIAIITSVATVFTTGGAFVAWLNRKTKQDRRLDQEHKDTEIDQLKIDVTKDVVIMLREELERMSMSLSLKNAHIEAQDKIITWLRTRVMRLEDWAALVLHANPDLPPIPTIEKHTER